MQKFLLKTIFHKFVLDFYFFICYPYGMTKTSERTADIAAAFQASLSFYHREAHSFSVIKPREDNF